jgi:hypothetical protein
MSSTKRLLILSFILISGCGGKPFNVKTRPVLPPIVAGARAEVDSVTIQAEAVTDEDFLLETFDANLILAGVLPVRVAMKNSAGEPVDLKSARFEVRPADGRAFKMIEAKKAFGRLISYYGISTYSKDGYKESQSTFASYAFDTTKPIVAGESRDGMLFFEMPDEDAHRRELTLAVTRFGAKRSKNDPAIELKLK